jgi:hypothetical protein
MDGPSLTTETVVASFRQRWIGKILIAAIRRVRVRFSLRTLLIMTLVSGIGLACLGNWMREIRAQRQIIDRLSARGYQISLDLDWGMWMHTRFGMNGALAVNGIESIFLFNSEVRATDLKAMGRLRFEGLYLYRCNITDDVVLQLCPNSKLNSFGATRCGLGDRTLKHLSQFDGLLTIDLCATSITDDGIGHLTRLKRLHTLSLPATPLTDKSIRHFRSMDQLELLSILGTSITPEGADELRRALPNCQILYCCPAPR